jgi:RNA polymerase sigma-70 factor (ECF subfamily)
VPGYSVAIESAGPVPLSGGLWRVLRACFHLLGVIALSTETTPSPSGEKAEEIAESVVRAARRGDRAAFDAIVDQYEERLRVLAFSLLHDRELMNDALQDTFVSAFRALPGFRGEAALGTWLYRICYRACLVYVKRGKLTIVAEEVAGPLAAPGDHVEDLVLRGALAAALGELPAEQRVAVLMVDRDGYGYRSVADVLGVPEGTVASRLSAARSSLRVALRRELDADGVVGGGEGR